METNEKSSNFLKKIYIGFFSLLILINSAVGIFFVYNLFSPIENNSGKQKIVEYEVLTNEIQIVVDNLKDPNSIFEDWSNFYSYITNFKETFSTIADYLDSVEVIKPTTLYTKVSIPVYFLIKDSIKVVSKNLDQNNEYVFKDYFPILFTINFATTPVS